jgi:carboxypeptidase family protein/polysaccharide lyase family 4-like protein
MTRLASALAALLLFGAGQAQGQVITITQPAGGVMQGPPPRDASAKTGTARIRGHVFAADTGLPLRKAQVRLFSPELRENRTATTDASGAYEIKELPAGRYTLNAGKGSFVSLQYGQLRPFEAGRPLEVLDGQTIEKVDFSLPRGSVVTGRILDEFGDATADVQVMALRYQFIQGRRRLTPAGRPSMTNDVGEFRLYGLPPGQYYLSATLRGMAMAMDATSDDRSGYAPTYYPGTPNVNEAQKLNVALGQTVSDINMTLTPVRTARISGTATDSSGKPISAGFVMVIQRTGMMFMGGGGAQIRPDGSFTISNVAPGDYTLQANVGGGFGPSLDNETAMATVTVTGEDVTGIHLQGVKPIVASGRIVVDPAQAKSLQPSMLRIAVAPAKPDDAFMGPGGVGKVNDDFSFEIKSRPGQQLIRLNAAVASLGWSTKAVRYNGVDVTDSGIDFRPAEDLSGIEIELTNHPTEISGIVTDARGEMKKDYTVVIFARDEQRWSMTSRYIGTSRPDQDGRFKVRSLPPGEYYAIALEYVEPGESSDPEFLARVRALGTTLSLNEGETKTIELKMSRQAS